MGVKLTERAVASAKADGKRREIPDALVPGLYLVVQPSGSKAWALRYRVGGRSRKWTVGAYPAIGLAAAREIAREAALKVARGVDPAAQRKAVLAAPQPDSRDLFENVVDEFLKRHARVRLRETTVRDYESQFRAHLVPAFRGRTIQSITKRDIADLLDGMLAAGLTVRANRCRALLKKLFNWAAERDVVDRNPVAGVARPFSETARDRVLDDDEIAIVWRAAGQAGAPFDALIRLLVLTGQRRTEVAGLEWREVDFERMVWVLPPERTKNGRRHAVPLSAPAAAIIKGLPRILGCRYAITTNGETPVSGYSTAKKRVDRIAAHLRAVDGEPRPLPAWGLHDLRRSFASGCARLGVQLPVIERAINHVSGSFGGVAGVYQRHTFEAEVRDCMDRWAAHVLRIAAGVEPPANVVALR